jgi:hypothetical protein
LRIAPGGAPANVAVALTRLGATAGFIGKVGDDPLGRLLHETLLKNGVDVSCFHLSRHSLTRVAMVTNDSDERQRFVFYGNAEIGYGHGYNGKPLPFFRNYYAGGPASVRGCALEVVGRPTPTRVEFGKDLVDSALVNHVSHGFTVASPSAAVNTQGRGRPHLG